MIIIAGPCQYENLDMSLEIAETCRDVCIENSIDYVFKASFDKANRTSLSGETVSYTHLTLPTKA